MKHPGLWKKINTSPSLIKLRHWEYWPYFIVYIPIYFYWLYLAVKARSFFFFSAGNPGILTGGLYGESKIDIINKIPLEFKPKTIFIAMDIALGAAMAIIKAAQFNYPVIAKPDVGERGLLVEKIIDEKKMIQHLDQRKTPLIIQECIEWKYEYNVLYYRLPDDEKGKINSITGKGFLSVTGDGQHSVLELMQLNPRACLQIERFQSEQPELMKKVPAQGEYLLLEPIGNHSRGTMFLNANFLINDKVVQTFDCIAKKIDGLNMLRFDVKCKSPEDLETGEHIMILEINGVGGEPTHIYDSAYPILKAYRDLLNHWKIIYQIATANHRAGIPYMTYAEAKRNFREYTQYKNSIK